MVCLALNSFGCLQPVVAVRFCPQLFQLQAGEQQPDAAEGTQQTDAHDDRAGHDASAPEDNATQQQPFQLPYRMVFAIATIDSIIIYDTQVCLLDLTLHAVCASVTPPMALSLLKGMQTTPHDASQCSNLLLEREHLHLTGQVHAACTSCRIDVSQVCLVLQTPTPLAILGSLHFEAITDLAWSCNGAFLAISSYDGFCRYSMPLPAYCCKPPCLVRDGLIAV